MNYRFLKILSSYYNEKWTKWTKRTKELNGKKLQST